MAAPHRRRRWVLLLLGLVAIVGAVGLLGGVRLARIAGDLRRAERQVDAAAAALEDGRLSEAQVGLDRAQAILTRANGRLYTSVELQLIGGIPVLSDNLDAVKNGVALASQLVNGGRQVLKAAEPLQSATGTLEVPLAEGALPLNAIDATQRQLASLYVSLPSAAEEPSGLYIVPSVRRLNDRLYAQAIRRRAQMEVLSRALQIVADMAGATNPRRYLIAVANTAEMRGSGGMILSYGELLSRDGDFTLGEFGRIDELKLAAPLPVDQVTLPEDYLRRWDGFDVTELWRNATMSGDFRLVAPTLLQMYQTARGVRADGVIQLDPQGLAAILEGIGPVDVPGLGPVSADNIVELTLNRAYFQFPGVEERSDVLGDIAEAVFTKLVNGRYGSLRPLGEALQRAVLAHHLLAYSANADTNAQYRWFGVDGALPGTDDYDLFQLTAQNLSGNKLDFYVDTALSITGERSSGEIGSIKADITLNNTAPPGQLNPRYVFGPFADNDQAPGQYRSVVSLYVPSGSELAGFTGAVLDEPTVQTEGGRTVIGYTVDVLAGTTSTVSLDIRLPPRPASPYALFLIPTPRVRPTTASVALDVDGLRIDAQVSLDRSWVMGPDIPARMIAPRKVPRDAE